MQWKRIFKEKGFYMAVAIQLFCLFFGHGGLGILKEPGFFYNFAVGAQLGLSPLLLPLIALLPAALFIGEDIETGFARLVLQRSGRGHYGLTRALQAISGGALAAFIGTALFGIITLLLSAWPGEDVNWRYAMERDIYAFVATPLYGLPYLAETALRFAFAAATWALIGLGISALCKGRGLTLGLTFLIHFSLVYFWENTYQLSILYWSPAVIQNPPGSASIPLVGFYLRQGFYFLLGAAFGGWALHRTLKQLQ